MLCRCRVLCKEPRDFASHQREVFPQSAVEVDVVKDGLREGRVLICKVLRSMIVSNSITYTMIFLNERDVFFKVLVGVYMKTLDFIFGTVSNSNNKLAHQVPIGFDREVRD